MGLRSLSATQIDVWLARPELAREPEAFARLMDVLPQEDRARVTSFQSDRSRREHLVARVLLRVALSRYARVRAEHWRFAVGEHGRPSLRAGQIDLDLRFSLSHTDGLVACAVALGRDVGIDVERAREDLSALELAERFFSPREAQDIRDRPVVERTARFFRYWTLKEAWLKARGLGLGAGLEGCAFRLDDDGGDENCLVADGGEGGGWRFWQWHPTVDHTLAVACEREPTAPAAIELRVVESEQLP